MENDGFIRTVKLAIAVQPTSFPDEQTKMLYALSFMTKGTAEVWAHNQTQAIIDGTSLIPTFKAFIKQDAFGDPDGSRTACIKLHDLKMSLSMSADEYTAQFEILAGRTNFNDATLEDAYSRGLSTAILDKIHAQPTLSADLKAWKKAACQIDHNHRCLLEMKRVQPTHTFSCPTPPRTSNNLFTTPPTASTPLSTVAPMDINLSCRRTEDRTCYNCGKRGHISPACPEPRKERIRAEHTQGTLEDMIAKLVAAALDARKVAQKKEEDLKRKDSQDFPVSSERHALLNKPVLSS